MHRRIFVALATLASSLFGPFVGAQLVLCDSGLRYLSTELYQV